MFPPNFFFFFISFALFYSLQISDTQFVAPPRTRSLRDVFRVKPNVTPRQTFQITRAAQSSPLIPSPNPIPQQDKTIQRRNVPFQTPFIGVPVQIEKVREAPAQVPTNGLLPLLPKLPAPRPLIKPNETEAERAERIHKSFDRLLTFVEIVGHVDNYVSSKWKNLVKTVSNFYENEEEPGRVGGRRFYGTCPHAH